MITAGIDIGSVGTKAVIVKAGQLLSYAVLPTGGNNRKTAELVFDEVLGRANISKSDVQQIFTTGYGRENIPFADRHITEITCHAAGIHKLFPGAKTILDIGGQDTKGIQLDDQGKVVNFVMNDKCAAGTGRFIDVMAQALGVRVDKLAELSRQSTSSVKISSMCTVFAESEVISLVAKGVPIPDIIKGILAAIAERSVILLRKLAICEPIVMSGGVANNRGLVRLLEESLQVKINIPEYPQSIGAFGAAILAQNSRTIAVK